MKKNGKCKENNDETEIIEANMTKSKNMNQPCISPF
jgi:hypothetical protein